MPGVRALGIKLLFKKSGLKFLKKIIDENNRNFKKISGLELEEVLFPFEENFP